MVELSDEMKVKTAQSTSDNEEYKRCMSIIKARLLTINEIIENQIVIPYQMLKVESIYLQFRMAIEMFYISYIVSRKGKMEDIWTKYEKVYQPSDIRKYLKDELEEYFPHPYVLNEQREGFSNISIVARPIDEKETFRFFNRCHYLLHEKNPYKIPWGQREAECTELLEEATVKVKQFWDLLKYHYRKTELSNGDQIGILCSFGHKTDQVNVANIIP